MDAAPLQIMFDLCEESRLQGVAIVADVLILGYLPIEHLNVIAKLLKMEWIYDQFINLPTSYLREIAKINANLSFYLLF